jgi:MSHA biogenesis protein MshJ
MIKAWLGKQEVRINGLSTRERVFLFLSVLVCLLAIADTFWMTPAQNAQRQLVQKFTAQSGELDRLRSELAVQGVPKDANRDARAELAQLQAQIGSINADINTFVPVTSGGPNLEQVLLQFLRRQDGLTLVSTGTLKEDLGDSAMLKALTSAMSGGLIRRGLELRVAGPYPQLIQYVKTLEAALPNLRWGTMQLKSDTQGTELTLRVYVLGVRP